MTPASKLAYITGKIKEVHADARRAISEFNSPTGGFSIQSFIVTADELPLGNHFHNDKEETFVILEGGGKVLLAQVNEDGQPIQIAIYSLEAGSVVKVCPRTAHTFFLKPGSRMICFSSKAFDENNKDMIPCTLG